MNRRGSRQRIAMTAVLPPRRIWLISKGPPPALEMQTPRGAPLINSPPVINGGDVREDVTPREICWKWIRAGCWEGQQPWIKKRGGEEEKRRLSARVNGLALNWLVCFVFNVKWIFIIFYVNRLILIIRWKINAGNNWFFSLLPARPQYE